VEEVVLPKTAPLSEQSSGASESASASHLQPPVKRRKPCKYAQRRSRVDLYRTTLLPRTPQEGKHVAMLKSAGAELQLADLSSQQESFVEFVLLYPDRQYCSRRSLIKSIVFSKRRILVGRMKTAATLRNLICETNSLIFLRSIMTT